MKMMNNEVYKTLRNSGFNPPVYVEGCGSISDFLPDSKTTGIYVLHLADGMRYVGQSVDISRRFMQHSLSLDDIRGVSFRPASKKQLSQIEKQTVSLLENMGVKLRNVLLASFTHATSKFSDVMPVEKQEKWLSDMNYVDIDGERLIDNDLRCKYAKRFNKFISDPKSSEIIDFLSEYIRIGIPAVFKGEVSFWAISCLPSSPMKTFCRVNIYWQEVLTVCEEDDELFYSFHLTKSLLKEYLKNVSGKGCEVTDHKYAPGGNDQINLAFKTTPFALAALQNIEVQKAVRKFNLGLMRKGGCQYGRFHCFDLADRILSQVGMETS